MRESIEESRFYNNTEVNDDALEDAIKRVRLARRRRLDLRSVQPNARPDRRDRARRKPQGSQPEEDGRQWPLTSTTATNNEGHVGHEIACVSYGIKGEPPANVALECLECGTVLIDFDQPETEPDAIEVDVGDRIRLTTDVERFPHFIAKKGETRHRRRGANGPDECSHGRNDRRGRSVGQRDRLDRRSPHLVRSGNRADLTNRVRTADPTSERTNKRRPSGRHDECCPKGETPPCQQQRWK